MGWKDEMHTFWMENIKGDRPLGRPRHRWEVIRMDWKIVDCMHLCQGRA